MILRRSRFIASDEMQASHRERGIQSRRGQGQNEGEQFYVRYCFADPTYAYAFFDRFGDERLTGPSRRSRSGSVALIQCCRTKPRGRGAPSDALANSARCAHFCSERL